MSNKPIDDKDLLLKNIIDILKNTSDEDLSNWHLTGFIERALIKKYPSENFYVQLDTKVLDASEKNIEYTRAYDSGFYSTFPFKTHEHAVHFKNLLLNKLQSGEFYLELLINEYKTNVVFVLNDSAKTMEPKAIKVRELNPLEKRAIQYTGDNVDEIAWFLRYCVGAIIDPVNYPVTFIRKREDGVCVFAYLCVTNKEECGGQLIPGSYLVEKGFREFCVVCDLTEFERDYKIIE